MQLRMWTYDLAREQAPTYDHLRRFCDTSLSGGYNAFGLYLEHRFAYPSTPWAHGTGCLTPELVQKLQEEFPELQIIPFVNLLGHFEGMLYTEHGKRFREERFRGMQACPCNEEFQALCRSVLTDTISIFTSDIVHIGGDETQQLGKCSRCRLIVEQAEAAGSVDGKATLYGSHFAPLAKLVSEAGRRPAVWGDMFLEHPTALDTLPQQTLIFDWQYFTSPEKTSRTFAQKGFDVVCCPTLHTYNAVWLHLPQSEANVRQAVQAARNMGAFGVCLTTWECGLFGNYETLLPAIAAAGELISNADAVDAELPDDLRTTPFTQASEFLASYAELGEDERKWAELMGIELQQVGGSFAFSGIRSSLKVRLLLNANPFLAWLYHHDEFTGEVGTKALAIVEHALAIAPNASMRGVSQFVKSAIEFVRFADQARQAYAQSLPGLAIAALSPTRTLFDDLGKVARATNINIGGSLADVERCRIAREHVEKVIARIKCYGDGSLGYLPAFEYITHPKFVPHDQAAWWLINSWANE